MRFFLFRFRFFVFFFWCVFFFFFGFDVLVWESKIVFKNTKRKLFEHAQC